MSFGYPVARLHDDTLRTSTDLTDNYAWTMPQGHILLSVLLFKDSSGMWIAQGLEHDISAHGANIEAVKLAFERTITGYLRLDAQHNREPLSSLRPAPKHFWDSWQRVAKKHTESIPTTDPSIPSAYAIQAITNEALVM